MKGSTPVCKLVSLIDSAQDAEPFEKDAESKFKADRSSILRPFSRFACILSRILTTDLKGQD